MYQQSAGQYSPHSTQYTQQIESKKETTFMILFVARGKVVLQNFRADIGKVLS